MHRERNRRTCERDVSNHPRTGDEEKPRHHRGECDPAGSTRETPRRVSQRHEHQGPGRILGEKQQSAHRSQRDEPGHGRARLGYFHTVPKRKRREREHHEKHGAAHDDGLLPDRHREQQRQCREPPGTGLEQPPSEIVGQPRGEPEQHEVEAEQKIVGGKPVGRRRRSGEKFCALRFRHHSQRPGDHERVERRMVQLRIRLSRVELHAAGVQKRDGLGKVDERRETLAAGQLPAHVGLDERALSRRAVKLFPRHQQR